MCGSFVIWLCGFLVGALNGDGDGGGRRRRGRLAFVSCCEAYHSVDRCYRLSSMLYLTRMDPLSFVQTSIGLAIGVHVLLD